MTHRWARRCTCRGTHTPEAHEFLHHDNFDLYVDSGDEEDEEDEDVARTEAVLDALGACRATLGAGDVSLYDGRCSTRRRE